jgi:hypothetical protein
MGANNQPKSIIRIVVDKYCYDFKYPAVNLPSLFAFEEKYNE